MNTAETIEQIQREAQQRIDAIRAAEAALGAAVADNAKSEAQRQQEAIEAAERAAALATWESETWPAIQAEMAALTADFDAHRASVAQVEQLIKSIPATHKALSSRLYAIVTGAIAQRLQLPDVTAQNRVRLTDEIKGRLLEDRRWGAGLSEGLRDYYDRKSITLQPADAGLRHYDVGKEGK